MIIHETDVKEKLLPGRYIRWLVDSTSSEGLNSDFLSSCIVRIMPRESVKPAHSHPDGEEAMYIVSGSGQAYMDGDIIPIKEGSLVLAEKNCVHMLRNTGAVELKVFCVYAPPADLATYKFHPEREFPN